MPYGKSKKMHSIPLCHSAIERKLKEFVKSFENLYRYYDVEKQKRRQI